MARQHWPDYIALLHREVVPALGCTEPVTIALATARATEALGNLPESIRVTVSANLLKNGMGVGVPGTGMTGLSIAAAVGATGGNPELELQVLRDLTSDQVDSGKAMLDEGRIKVELAETDEMLLAEVEVTSGEDRAFCRIAREHDAIVRLEKNDTILLDRPWPGDNDQEKDWPLTIAEIHEFATEAPLAQIRFILEAARLNQIVATEGLTHDWGLKVGKSIDEDIALGLRSDDLLSYAIKLTAAASDARMEGITEPVMSNSGSGNQGITATMPVVAVAHLRKSGEEALTRALIMSHLTSIHLKHHLGRLSALCGAILAATGAACGIALLLGHGLDVIDRTIKNMVGNIAGMICDGAKTSCALKVASCVEAAISAVLLAIKGTVIPGKDGIVDDDLETCIANLGRLGTAGMAETDKVILDIMVNKA